MYTRRDWISLTTRAAAAAMTTGALGAFAAPAPTKKIIVYKSPSCGCCREWVKRVEAAGFTVVPHDVPDMSDVKASFHVPDALSSCHTGVIGGYVIEGHVPPDLIKRVVAERPKIAGLAVPGMPVGAPGMEMDGRPADHYDVIAFDRAGKTKVYAKR